MRIGIIGLGLIGGSLAMAMRAAPSAKEENIWAVELDPAVRSDALDTGVLDQAFADMDEAPVESADLVLLCLHPAASLEMLPRIAPRLAHGAVISDVCGIKGPIAARAREVLPPRASGPWFIGGHPMAGKERGGFVNASPTLFHRAHYLLCPEGAPPAAVELLRSLAMRIGCRDVILTDPATHDANIAYTSQMMHVLALAICEQRPFAASYGFEGNSFRGATRVAALEADLWSELFWDNREALARVVGELAGKLGEYRALLDGGDREALARRLRETSERKKRE
ncbi:MAG: prephenate dehydrogenase [Clostridia bacterium]|nr:prephenate dehydrogenase [Clostridia bacterium]